MALNFGISFNSNISENSLSNISLYDVLRDAVLAGEPASQFLRSFHRIVNKFCLFKGVVGKFITHGDKLRVNRFVGMVIFEILVQAQPVIEQLNLLSFMFHFTTDLMELDNCKG